MPQLVEVVAAVIARPDGSYLLAQRPQGKVYAGYWEFPGGKVEPGETHFEAIVREIREELGIEVLEADPWLLRRHDYEHASVRLRFFRVRRWRGVPVGLDGQCFEFQTPGRETVGPMLPANGPVLKALELPATYAITHAGELGAASFLLRLESALGAGLRLVQVREGAMPHQARRDFALAVLARCRAHGARMLVNADVELAQAIGADGVHLTSTQLAKVDRRPDLPLIGVSAHNGVDLRRALAIDCDFAVLGPVLPTPTHPEGPLLGWTRFGALASDAQLPVYALGGLAAADLPLATANNAHGIAMLRGAWP